MLRCSGAGGHHVPEAADVVARDQQHQGRDEPPRRRRRAPARPGPSSDALDERLTRPPLLRSWRSRGPAGVTVCGSNSPTSRPRSSTWIVSDRPISSSRSAEISSTARPVRRACLMWSQIGAWAPTSTPRVGCEAISSTGSPLISRPTMSFCWLPPDSARAVVSMPGVRTSYVARRCARCPCGRPPRLIQPPLTDGGRVWWPRMRFSHSGASSSSPWRWRSSGM